MKRRHDEKKTGDTVLVNRYETIPCTGELDLTVMLSEFSYIFEQTRENGGVENKAVIGLHSEMLMEMLKSGQKVTLKLSINESGLYSATLLVDGEVLKGKVKFARTISSERLIKGQKEEHEFQEDVKRELQRIEAEVDLESLCFNVIDTVRCLQKKFHSFELDNMSKTCTSVLDWLNTEESPPHHQLLTHTEALLEMKKRLESFGDPKTPSAAEPPVQVKMEANSNLIDETQKEFEPEIEKRNSKVTPARELVRDYLESGAGSLERCTRAVSPNVGTSVVVTSNSQETLLSGNGYPGDCLQCLPEAQDHHHHTKVKKLDWDLKTTASDGNESRIRNGAVQKKIASCSVLEQTQQNAESLKSKTDEHLSNYYIFKTVTHGTEVTNRSSGPEHLHGVQTQHLYQSSSAFSRALCKNGSSEGYGSQCHVQKEPIAPSVMPNYKETEEIYSISAGVSSNNSTGHLLPTKSEYFDERRRENNDCLSDGSVRKNNAEEISPNQRAAISCTNVSRFSDAECQTRSEKKTDSKTVETNTDLSHGNHAVRTSNGEELDDFSRRILTCSSCTAVDGICWSHSRQGFTIFKKLNQLKNLLCLPSQYPQ